MTEHACMPERCCKILKYIVKIRQKFASQRKFSNNKVNKPTERVALTTIRCIYETLQAARRHLSPVSNTNAYSARTHTASSNGTRL